MEIKDSIAKQIEIFLKEKGIESPFTLDIPKDKSHGDLTTNIALAISKKLGKNPRELATELKEFLENKKINGVKSIEIAGAGFLNFKTNEDHLSTLNEIVSKDLEYGKEEKKNKKVMVEYGQPNTHKALQIGHMKSGLIGASIIKLLENSGYDVIKANYYSDVGKHVAKCMYGLLLDNNESIEESTNKVKEIEKESGVNDVAKYLNECYAKASSLYEVDEKAKEGIDKINLVIYSDLDKDTPIMNLYRLTKEMSEEHQNLVFGELGVVFDRQYPESEIFKDGLELVKKHTPDIFIPDQGTPSLVINTHL
jgi:arginyl-tRNA synthetase